jgi:uncharacterized protein (TIGR03435 family)
MPEQDDHQLLAEFVREGSESAFSELVRRYVALVYSTALRFSSNPHHAEEITQAVFIILARKAGTMSSRVLLSGWLYQAARLTAANFVKGEIRRARREQEVFMQSTLPDAEITDWEKIAPLLDEAMGRLGETDRNALVLRFLENRSAVEIGAALRMNEETARKRVNRALEKLRKLFARQGVNSTAETIAGTISANSIQAAPVALAKSVTIAAMTKGATATASTLTLIKGALKIMAWTKAQTTIVAGAVAILIIGTTTVAVKTVEHFVSPPVEQYFTGLSTQILDTAPPLLILRPSHYSNQGDYAIAGTDYGPEGRLMLRGCSFPEILSTAYGVGPQQMVLPADLPQGQFDLLLTVPNNPRQALQAEIKKKFGLVGNMETRDTDVLVLNTGAMAAARLNVSSRGGPSISWEPGNIKLLGYKMSAPSGYDLTHTISMVLNQPVIDETGLTDAYDMNLRWSVNLTGDALEQDIKSMLHDQYGLELVPTNMPIGMLVVEKAE